MREDFDHLGDYTAGVKEWGEIMACTSCRVTWLGCWDCFQCPICGDGDIYFVLTTRKPVKQYENLGNLSALTQEHSRQMDCHACRVTWLGCWDNFQCPRCGHGELPSYPSTVANAIKELKDAI